MMKLYITAITTERCYNAVVPPVITVHRDRSAAFSQYNHLRFGTPTTYNVNNGANTAPGMVTLCHDPTNGRTLVVFQEVTVDDWDDVDDVDSEKKAFEDETAAAPSKVYAFVTYAPDRSHPSIHVDLYSRLEDALASWRMMVVEGNSRPIPGGQVSLSLPGAEERLMCMMQEVPVL